MLEDHSLSYKYFLQNTTSLFVTIIAMFLTNFTVKINFFSGPLSKVGDLSHSFINSSTISISWSPPFTLPGTAITGYNITVTSNGSAIGDFTSDSFYVIQLSDITDSPCNEININVSGYNGLDGEINSISGIYLASGKLISVHIYM